MLIRSFIAADIPHSVKTSIGQCLAPLQSEIHGVKWVPAENFHLTLKFLGNAEPERLERLKEKLGQVLNGLKKFSIVFSNLNAFPDMKDPQTLWLGIGKGEQGLKVLAERAETASIGSGFQKEARPYTAHLTLARVRDGRKLEQHEIKALASIDLYPDAPVLIDRVVLYRSISSANGSQYEPLKVIGLI